MGGGGVAGAERGWVTSFLALNKGLVIQFSATHGGWVILFPNRDRHTFKCLVTTGTIGI